MYKVEYSENGRDFVRYISIENNTGEVVYGRVATGLRECGKFIWDRTRFDSPLFISSVSHVNGKSKRIAKSKLNQAIKSIILEKLC